MESHTFYIVLGYGITFLALAGITLISWLDYRRTKTRLAEVESQSSLKKYVT